MGGDEFEKQYGEWDYSEYDFKYNHIYRHYAPEPEINMIERKRPVDLDNYSMMLPEEKYQCEYVNQSVILKKNDAVVLEYPICSIIRQSPMLLHHPEQLFTYRNDSLMLVLDEISINDPIVTSVRTSNYRLFKKK